MEGTAAGPKLEVLHHRGPRRTLRVTQNDQFSVSFNLGSELAARLALDASAAAALQGGLPLAECCSKVDWLAGLAGYYICSYELVLRTWQLGTTCTCSSNQV